MKILLIEDDADTSAYVRRGLREAGHVVEVAATADDGAFLASQGSHDVMIVDRMIPGGDGLTLVKTLRGGGTTTPVLFLTALDGVNDRVEGLEAGADYYLVKPFAFSELLARVNALGRRPPLSRPRGTVAVADLEMDVARRTVTRGGRRIDLTPQEFRLLEYMLGHAGQVVTRSMLLEKVWDFQFDPQTNIVDAHVSRLRAKIDRGFATELIRTVRGSGYIIDVAR